MINKFTFYENYYQIIKFLPDKDRLSLYDSIMKYMFEDEEPNLKALLNGIWVNIKMPLDTNKKNIKNGQNGGRPSKPIDNPDDNPKETQEEPKHKPKAKANNISYFLFLISNNNYNNINDNDIIINKIKEWLEYKQQKKTKYTEIGLQKLINKIDNCIGEYGVNEVVDVIDYSMSNNYQGIIFDKFKKKNGTKEILPDWYGKQVDKEQVTDEEAEELKEMFKEFE